MTPERFGALPLGELHHPSQCVYCGWRFDLKMAVVVSTRAWGPVCRDPVACVRRRVKRL